jgi:hypothetical protein
MPLDGNGGGRTRAYIVAGPRPISFGNVVQSTAATVVVTVRCIGTTGDSASVSSTTISGSDFTLSGLLTNNLNVGQSYTFNVNINSAVLGAKSQTLTIIWSGDPGSGTISIPVTATVVSTNITVVPSSLNFGDVVVNTNSSYMQIVITNNTGGTIHLTGGSFSNPDFNWQGGGVPAFPITIINGGIFAVGFQVIPSVTGPGSCTCTITTDVGGYSVVIQLSDTGVLLVESFPLANATRVFLIGGLSLRSLDPTNFNSELAQILIFNGTLWDKPGQEKVLRRLEVFYENLGVCNITATVTSISYRPDKTKFTDSASSIITLGDVSADGLEYSTFEDLQLAGEILLLSITRAVNAGSCSLIGFTPHFEDKGEKVENV